MKAKVAGPINIIIVFSDVLDILLCVSLHSVFMGLFFLLLHFQMQSQKTFDAKKVFRVSKEQGQVEY